MNKLIGQSGRLTANQLQLLILKEPQNIELSDWLTANQLQPPILKEAQNTELNKLIGQRNLPAANQLQPPILKEAQNTELNKLIGQSNLPAANQLGSFTGRLTFRLYIQAVDVIDRQDSSCHKPWKAQYGAQTK